MWFANNRTTVYCRCPFTHSVRPTVHTIEPIVNYTYETVAGRRSRNENKCFLSGLPNHRERSTSLWKWRCLRYSCNKSKGLVTSTMYWCTRVHEFWKKTSKNINTHVYNNTCQCRCMARWQGVCPRTIIDDKLFVTTQYTFYSSNDFSAWLRALFDKYGTHNTVYVLFVYTTNSSSVKTNIETAKNRLREMYLAPGSANYCVGIDTYNCSSFCV